MLRDLADLESQHGRRWLITGATYGLGTEVAVAAARAGADLVLVSRDMQRAQALAQRLRAVSVQPRERAEPRPAITVELVQCDLSELDSVHRAAELITGDIDVMINNAGRITTHRQQNSRAQELLLATNFLGPFALTNLLIPQIRSRIVILGSGAHSMGRLNAADPHFRRRRWSFGSAYAQSKLCDMLWARALSHRLGTCVDARRHAVDVQLAHPGWALTNLQNVTRSALVNTAITAVCSGFAQSAEAGALSVLAAAVSELEPLSYTGPDGWRGMRGKPAPAEVSAPARDDDAAEAVWELGVSETGVGFPG